MSSISPMKSPQGALFTVTLPETAVEEMRAGEWDLTLFTCTYDGRARVTVRCIRTEE